MTPRMIQMVVIVALVISVLSGSMYTLRETERGVLLQFGEVIDPDLKPGLGYKLPLVHEIRKFDARTQVSDAERTEFLTQENKFLIVDAFVMWKVANVKKYFTVTGGDPRKAELLLMPRVKDGLKNKVSERTVREVVSGQRDQMMTDLAATVNQAARKELGIQVVDIRVKRVDFPESTSESIYNRMRTEREREAREHRSQGNEMAETIKANADREQRVLLAEAYRKAEILRGEGDGRAAAISGAAFGKDPEFYRFYRSLQAYRASFNKPGDVFVLKGDSEFLKYMKSGGK